MSIFDEENMSRWCSNLVTKNERFGNIIIYLLNNLSQVNDGKIWNQYCTGVLGFTMAMESMFSMTYY
jgi:hypothetical protein